MTAGLSGVVVCGTALIASCTLLYCPVPSAATTSVVCAARAPPAQTVRQASRPNAERAAARGDGFVRFMFVAYGHSVRELRVLPFFAGSMLTLRKEIEPAFCNISEVSTPRNVQSTKRTSSITAPGQLAIHITRGLDALRTFCSSTFLTTRL